MRSYCACRSRILAASFAISSRMKSNISAALTVASCASAFVVLPSFAANALSGVLCTNLSRLLASGLFPANPSIFSHSAPVCSPPSA